MLAWLLPAVFSPFNQDQARSRHCILSAATRLLGVCPGTHAIEEQLVPACFCSYPRAAVSLHGVQPGVFAIERRSDLLVWVVPQVLLPACTVSGPT